MGEADKKDEKRERRFSEEQYDMLRWCSARKDVTEWNLWRKEGYPNKDILLEGARLQRAHLKGAFLNTGLNSGFSGEVYLEGAKFHGAHLEDADLSDANLQGAKFLGAHLNGVDLRCTRLQGADFSRAIIDGGTLIWQCEIDRKTKFEGVGLDGARIYPETKQLLEYNIRRMNWEEWYKQHKILKWPVWLFWLMSNYGLSTGRIIITFFVLAIAFACIYYVWGMIAPPGIVDYLFVDGNGVGVVWWLVPIRAIHFSVVIMTVGFTNMHANAHSMWAHILVSLQMILGFVLLGALVTRFAVLFTAGGPAGKFADENKKEEADNGNDEVS
jgi:hypothetical protein